MNLTVTTCQIIVILALAILGGFVLIKRPKHRAGQILAILCFLTCGWIAVEMATDPFEANEQLGPALFLRNLTKFFTTHMVATLVCFAWYFPRKSPKIGRKHLTFIYLIALIFAVGAFTPYDARPQGFKDGGLDLKYGPLHFLYFGYMVVCGLYALGHLLYKYRKFKSPIARVQIQYVTVGLGLSYLIAIFFSLILPLFGLTRYFFVGTLAPSIGFFFMAYVIVKYRAMEIETVVHRTVIWLLMSSLVLLPVSVVIFLTGKWIRGLSNWELALFATATFFPFFAYLRKIQPLIDRLFQRDYYAMRAAIDQMIEGARELKELPALAHQVIRTTQQVLHVPHVTLLVYREPSQAYMLMDMNSERQTTLKIDHPAVRMLAKHDAILEREQVEFQPQHASIRKSASDYFQKMAAEVCVPFVHEQQLIGALNLGRRTGKQWSFSVREIDLLARFRAAITLALDNSLLHEAQLELQEKNVQAELIATASSTLAHSIKNPLGLLDANLDLLRDTLAQVENDDADLAISDIEAQIRRIEHIVNQIRNADIGEPDLAPCRLNFVIGEALAEVKRANPQSSVKVDMPDNEIPEILGDTSQLRLAFINLITNAYEAMASSDGTLKIHSTAIAYQNAPAVQVEVHDTGCGMPQDFIQRIMNRPFNTRKRAGSGLGVWTTKKIIEAHNGSLDFTSQEAVGTTAIVILPLSIS